ncbi:ABC transporter ATP-binding protein [Devosia sp. 1566]|uniref:ABC transporter ATP-binding protein n=1 Tax=Devosia sp. 1566 TaxID=2499144 RepID=UPI000FDB66E6|nr:ABC transporter ATP-binding protein [Devosia sp. 1566]
MTPAVELHDLSKRYGRHLALDGVGLTINRGEVFALLGPNGAGKTTLLHILCTLLAPDSGTAKVGGADVMRDPLRVRRNLGVVFQTSSLDGRLTVRENLEFHGMVYGVPKALRRDRIQEVLAAVELADRANALVQTLSAGMKRRLEIARALVHDARILVMDEPTVGLDARSRDAMWDYIAKLRAERDLTLIITTHYVEEVENCDRVCIIDQGKVVALDTPHALKSRYGQEYMRLRPVDAAAAQAIQSRYPELVTPIPEGLLVRIPQSQFTREFLGEFGDRLTDLSFDRSSLASVFLAITGRQLERPEPVTPKREGRR